MSVLKLKVPTFSVKTTEWQLFGTVFIATIDDNIRLTPAEKTCYLITAMGSEDSKQLATRAVGATMDYYAAVAALLERYERKRTLFKLHFQCLFADRKTRYNHSDITQILNQVKVDRTGIELCGALTADHFIAAKIEESLEGMLKDRWTSYASDIVKPLSLNQITSFLTKQLPGLPEDMKSFKPSQPLKAHSASVHGKKLKSLVFNAHESKIWIVPFALVRHTNYLSVTLGPVQALQVCKE